MRQQHHEAKDRSLILFVAVIFVCAYLPPRLAQNPTAADGRRIMMQSNSNTGA